MSFFDDDDDDLPETTIRRPRSPRPARPAPPSPRAPRGARTGAHDAHAIVVRRRVVAGIGLAVLIVIVLIIAALGGGSNEAIEKLNTSVSTLGRESTEQIATPFFQALSSARGEQGTDVAQRLNGLREEAERQAERARGLAVPEGLGAAQRYLLEVLDLRAEGIAKVAGRIGVALGGQSESQTAYKQLAGDMEIFVASDVLYSQRVVPLIQEALAKDGVSGQSTAPSRFLPNLGWLEAATVAARTGGHAPAGATTTPGSGAQGSALLGVSVGSNQLAPPPELNHVKSGQNPTFTVKVEDAGSGAESNVGVGVTVTAAGKQYSAFGTIPMIAPGKSATVGVPVEGVPLNTGAKVQVNVEPVPGETNLENNKGTYEAIFS